MNPYFTRAIIREGSVPSPLVDKVSARAEENQKRYYSLLRSTGIEGVEELIAAIHGSTFSTSHSHSHHHYTTGTLEHCLGVYDEMLMLSQGTGISQTDIILTALLHDVGKGFSKQLSAFSGHHPERSMKIVRRYLGCNVSRQVLEAIRYHQHHNPSNPLQDMVCTADHHDAAKCNRTEAFLRSL